MKSNSLRKFSNLLLLLLIFASPVAMTQDGPGGVEQTDGTSALEWWVRADKDAYINEGIDLTSNLFAVTQWNDQSGYGRNILQTSSVNKPRFYENVFNGQPVVRFDGSSADFLGPLSIDAFQNNYSIFIVGYTAGDNESFVGVTFPTDPGIFIEGLSGNSVRFLHRNPTGTSGGNDLQAGSTRSTATAQILTFSRGTPATGDQQFWIDGADNQSTIGSGSNFSSSGTLVLGRRSASEALNYLDGDMSEIIIMSKEVNEAERIIVENYLSAKYDIALGANDVYRQDDNVNGDFDFEVAGIGRVDASNIHNEAQGTGIIRILNPTGLGDNEFLMWGHDNAELQQVEKTDVPGTIDARLTRVWKVSELDASGSAVDVGNIDIRFDLSGIGPVTVSDLRLLIDTDDNGAFDDIPIATAATDLGNNIYEFAGISAIADGLMFSIGSLDDVQTPLTVVGTSLTGPGGVEQANGASALEWWLKANEGVFEDAGTDHAESGDAVYQWNDQSGFDRHIDQTTVADQPEYSINALNGRPVIRFDRVQEESLGPLSIDAFQNNYSIFMIASSGGGGRSLMSIIFPTQHGILLQADSPNDLRFLHRNPTGTSGGNNLVGGNSRIDDERQILSLSRGTPSTGTQQYWINGSDNQTTTATNANFTSAGTIDLGHLPTTASGRYLDGDIAEVILISKEVNEAERIIIENYLSAKYDITLGANNVYLQDDNANGDYDFEVAGIGRVDASNINPQAQGSGMVRILNPTDMDDDEFLLWGHDNGLDQAVETSDVPAGIEARFKRVWRVSEVNSAGTAVEIGNIDIAWEITASGDITTSDLRLLIDTDNDGVFNDETPISGAISLGSNIYQFTDVSTLDDNLRFTLGTSLVQRTPISPVDDDPTGPGGVGTTDGSSTLEFWFDANDLDADGDFTDNPANGTAVTLWEDKSGNDRDASSFGTNDPVYMTSATNNFPGIDFASNDDKLQITGIPINSSASLFVVFEHQAQTAGGSYRSLWTNDGSEDYYSMHTTSSTTDNVHFIFHNTFFTSSYTAALVKDGNPHLMSIYGRTLGFPYIDNDQYGNPLGYSLFPGSAPANTYIGGDPSNADQEYLGYITELFGYWRELNDAEKNIVSNYLSAKYDFTLATNDIYDQDDNANGDYDHEVAGIGRVDASNIHADAQGTGIVRILNPGGLNDDEYLIWGHDNGDPIGTEIIDIPGTIEARLDRVWRVTESNAAGTSVDVGSIDIRWDMNRLGAVTRSDLTLLIDTDKDGVFNDETPIYGAIDIGGNYYQFTGVTGIEDNVRFTLGTGNSAQTPLPIELLKFEASALDNKYVMLRWQTAAEINNDFFTIEKSKDANSWISLGIIDGAGNSSEKLSYKSVDDRPYSGISYYRLKQTDFDGKFTYSDIKVVTLNGLTENQINIYPNPGTDQMTIEGNKVELAEFALYNIYGQNVKELLKVTDQNTSSITIDISRLSNGIYTLKTKNQIRKIIKN